MTSKSRRPRRDGIANLHRILAGASNEIAPPAHVPLQDNDWPYFENLIEEAAKADWTPHQVDILALLARTMAELEAQQRQLRLEGMTTRRKDGTLGINPRSRVVATLSAQTLAWRRSLGLTARAKAGSTRDAVELREANRRAESNSHSKDDGLLT